MSPQTSKWASVSLLPSFHLGKSRFILLIFLFGAYLGIVGGFTTFPVTTTKGGIAKCGKKVFVVDDGNGISVGRRSRQGGLSVIGDDIIDDRKDAVGCIHHTALKTRNITLAIQFYSLLGFEPTAKFKAGPARAAWLEQQQKGFAGNSTKAFPASRIELIEVPSWLLKEPEGMKRRALDLFENQEYLGQNHFALDVTKSIIESNISGSPSSTNQTFLLSAWMETLNEKSLELFRKTLRVALEAEQFMVGNTVYERAFIYDADGALIELLNKAAELPQYIDPMAGWERYEWFEEKNMGDPEKNDNNHQ